MLLMHNNIYLPSGARTNLKVGGAPIRRKAPEIFFGCPPPPFGSKSTIIVVLVSAFVVVSTI